jgi:hypothetical protein
MTTNDGGPAFPGFASDISNGDGMSLRDWFAGKAMQGILSAQVHGLGVEFAEQFAKLAYKQADAMLAAREKEMGNG